MYITVDGKQQLNSAELLLDLYIDRNSCKSTDFIKKAKFIYDENGNLHINNLSASQRYLSGFDKFNDMAISSFLRSKNIFLDCVKTKMTSFEEGNCNLQQIEDIKKEVAAFLSQSDENNVQIGVLNTKEHKFRFIDEQGNIYKTTNDWNEGSGGHAVYVTGLSDDGFIVSSWGRKLLIPYEDFIDNKFSFTYFKIRER